MKRRTFIETGLAGSLLMGGGLFSSFKVDHSKPQDGKVNEAARSIPVGGEYDVIISGGGPAGVSAAIEAGRNGAKTLVVETQGCLGGVWTSGLLTWILDHHNKAGLMLEIKEKLLARAASVPEFVNSHQVSFNPEYMKLLLEDLCQEANVDLIFHARVVGSVVDRKKRITHLITESKSGREAWKGKVFIDATGDGDLAALSGCGFDLGEEKTGALQPFSLLALITGVNLDEIPSRNLVGELKKAGITPSYPRAGLFPIRKNLFKMMATHLYGYSPLNAMEVTKATLKARKEVTVIVEALQSLGGPWTNIQLVATGEQIGIREARRIHGLYTVTTDDLIKGARFDDAICRVKFGVDVHAVNQKDDEANRSYARGIKSKEYDIPLRSLIAKDVGGLMMAGRCISGDFIAHSSYRVTGNAVIMGQAAGRVAAISSKYNALPQDVSYQSLGF